MSNRAATEAALRRAVKDSGSHFLDQKTMEFFNSRVHDVIEHHDGYRFITSERMDDEYPDRYTVREFGYLIGGGVYVDNIGDFQQYESLADAQAHLTDLN